MLSVLSKISNAKPSEAFHPTVTTQLGNNDLTES